MNANPIGIFDSGVGGLSIWKEITELLPCENTIYLADSANAPYGEKSEPEILNLCIKNTEKLLSMGCKIIVIACNTATTNTIHILRNRYNVSFIGIEPAIKPASLFTKSKHIGILATKGTLNSTLFSKTSKLHLRGIHIMETEGKGLVELIEQGKINGTEINVLLRKYLKPMLYKEVDCIVLGCTHYPFLIPQIRNISKDSIKIIDSGLAVAKQTKTVIYSENIKNTSTLEKGNHKIYSNTKFSTIKMLIGSENENTTFILEKF